MYHTNMKMVLYSGKNIANLDLQLFNLLFSFIYVENPMSFKFTNKIWNRNILNLNISKKKTEKGFIIAAILRTNPECLLVDFSPLDSHQ